MRVLPDISLSHVRDELEQAEPHIKGLGLELDTSMLSAENLRFRVSGHSRVDDEIYIVEFTCDDYRVKPPFVEMVDPASGQLGTKHAYPNCFHGHPCICARFNRKAYTGFTGLHSEWKFEEWATDRATDHLGGMISHIFSQIHGYSGNYSGRQA